jgi:hypothetical protein
MKEFCKEYLQEVKSLFPIKSKKERKYISNLGKDIEIFCKETNVISKEGLYVKYGNPIDVVKEYFNSIDTSYVVKKVNIAKYIKAFVAAILVLALIASSVFCVVLYQEEEMIDRQSYVISQSSTN